LSAEERWIKDMEVNNAELAACRETSSGILEVLGSKKTIPGINVHTVCALANTAGLCLAFDA
jgi:hypothetical protein